MFSNQLPFNSSIHFWIAVILIGMLCGFIYFQTFEQFDETSMPEKCWTLLHYLNKKSSITIMVHIKSIVTGIILILAAMYQYYTIIIIFGSCIIGLHLAQMYNEQRLIKSKSLNAHII